MNDKRLKNIEKKLINYDYIDADIEGLELEKNILLENNTYGITSLNYDSIKVSRTNNVNKRFENEIIEFIEKIDLITNKIAELKTIKALLNVAISRLSPIKQDIIRRGYIKDVKWNLISKENFITQKTLRKYKLEALKSISDYLIEKGY